MNLKIHREVKAIEPQWVAIDTHTNKVKSTTRDPGEAMQMLERYEPPQYRIVYLRAKVTEHPLTLGSLGRTVVKP